MSDISSKVRDISDQDDGARSSLGLKPMELDTPEPMHKNVDLAAPATPVTDAGQHMSTPSYGWMTAVTVLLIAMWLIGSSAVLYGFFDLGTNMSNLTPITIAAIVTAIFIPASMILLMAFALRRLKALSRQAYLLSQAAFELTQPDTALVGKTQQLNQRIKAEIDSLDARIGASIDKVGDLETLLEVQSNTIQAAAISVTDSAETISIALSRQGDELEQISAKINTQMNELSETLSQLKAQQDNLSPALDGAMQNAKTLSDTVKETAQDLETTEHKAQNTLSALSDAANLMNKTIKQTFADMETQVEHSRNRAQDISETANQRINKNLSETRDEIAQIEADMLDLQSRMQNASQAHEQKEDTQSLAEQAPEAPAKLKIGNLHLTAIEDDPEINVQEANVLETPAIPDIPSTDLDIMPLEADMQPDVSNASEPGHSLDSHGLDNFLHRPIEDPQARHTPRWSWRKLLSKADRPAETSAIDQLTSPATPQASHSEDIISALVTLGLTPHTVVDDGCIIEATNIRKSKGEDAMSRTVAIRLSEPVMHLKNSLDMDSNLKVSLRDFVDTYRLDIADISADREAIRTHLESETGRSFLLCDAALNG